MGEDRRQRDDDRRERRLIFVEVDALLIMMVYAAGMWFLYQRGVGV